MYNVISKGHPIDQDRRGKRYEGNRVAYWGSEELSPWTKSNAPGPSLQNSRFEIFIQSLLRYEYESKGAGSLTLCHQRKRNLPVRKSIRMKGIVIEYGESALLTHGRRTGGDSCAIGQFKRVVRPTANRAKLVSFLHRNQMLVSTCMFM